MVYDGLQFCSISIFFSLVIVWDQLNLWEKCEISWSVENLPNLWTVHRYISKISLTINKYSALYPSDVYVQQLTLY